MNSTIAAIATPLGVGAVSVIRISGSEAGKVIQKCFSHAEAALHAPRVAVLGRVLNEKGETIDEVLATYFISPASFTGEDTVELSCHGGIYVTQAVLKRVLECGASPAEPGEFTQRAFLNEKLDLTQAEGVMDIISAQSDLALRAAQGQLQGSIREVTEELRSSLIEITAHLEAYIDFPEDDIDPKTGEQLTARLQEMKKSCEALLSTNQTGKILREGARVALCGEPNAGKSSLLNAFLGYDRAIVSETKGTTRDTVEEIIEVCGVPVRFIDTAGLRESEDQIEKQGIDRAYREINSADLIIEVLDGTVPPTGVSRPKIPEGVLHLPLLNKADLSTHPDWSTTYDRLSCKSGLGISELPEKIASLLLEGRSLTGSSLIAINARHQACLRSISEQLDKADEEISTGTDPELISVTLRETLSAIGEITGKVDTEEILGEIFSQFCIGK